MIQKKQFVTAAVFALVLMVFVSSSALAHACFPVDKTPGAGSIGTYNIVTESFTPAKKNVGDLNNGGFFTVTDGASFSYDVFLHTYLPEGALAAGPGGDDECDGRGIDEALACLGIPH